MRIFQHVSNLHSTNVDGTDGLVSAAIKKLYEIYTFP